MKMRTDGLYVCNMNAAFGGIASHMNPSTSSETGDEEGTLEVGDTQQMNFTAHDEGPFWMTPIEKLSPKYDYYDGTMT